MTDKTPEQIIALAKQCGGRIPTGRDAWEQDLTVFNLDQLQAFAAAALTAAKPVQGTTWALHRNGDKTVATSQPVLPTSLPPLPSPTWMMPVGMAGKWDVPGAFTSEQMREYARTALAQPAADSLRPWDTALNIRMGQGWKLKGDRIPVLYTDTINGDSVGRDDIWLATTAALSQPAALPVPTGWREFLDELEWSDWDFDSRGEGKYHCPTCGKEQQDGHHANCQLAAFLAAPPQPETLPAYDVEAALRSLSHIWDLDGAEINDVRKELMAAAGSKT